MPTFYECQRCAACCQWPGLVKVDNAEVEALARFLEVTVETFVERFTELRPDRKGLTLKEKQTGECVFLEGRNCAIQSQKPQQCRDFPYLWRHPDMKDKCQAIPVELESNEYLNRVSAATGRSTSTLKRLL